MATVREVHDAFETMIEEQGTIASRLSDQKGQVSAQATELQTRQTAAIRTAVTRLLGEFEGPVMARFDDAFITVGDNPKPGDVYKSLRKASAVATDKLDDLGNPAKPSRTADELQKQVNVHLTEQQRLQTQRQDLAAALEPVMEQEKRATAKGFPKFSDVDFWGDVKVWTWMTSSTYRKARKTALNWQGPRRLMPASGPFHCLAAAKHLDTLQAEATAEKTKAETMQDKLTIRQLHDDVLSEAEIRSRVVDSAVELVSSRGRMLDSLVEMLPEGEKDALLTRGAKIVGLGKLQEGLQTRIDGVISIKSDLERPMRNLRRARRSRGSRQVRRLDLEDVKRRVATGAALNTLAVNHAVSAAADIGRWQPSAQRRNTSTTNHSTLDSYNTLMLAYLLMSGNNDNFFTATVFDGAADVAQDKGVDLDALSPDVSGLDLDAAGLGDIDVSDLGDIKVDVGGVDVGTIDVPTIDTGSMGGFDGGGFGGGFDGGGGF
ncbi:MAG: hypothetical protein Alpg2KO_11300 [Alphaproteobacteria bacterium]